MKKTKNVLIKIELKGRGIVNFDSAEQQKWMRLHNGQNHDNTSFSKKNFYRDEKGELKWKIKISSECLKQAMFEQDMIGSTTAIIHDENVMHALIASPYSLIRGYLFAKKNNFTYKRKSPLTLSSAEQTCNAEIVKEFFSKKSGRQKKEEENEKSDNVIYNKETVGEISYRADGVIDLNQMQFVSCDEVFDRYSFSPDNFGLYKSLLKSRLPNFDSELGYYKLNGSVVDMPEYGFKLSQENVDYLVKMTLKRILGTQIKRSDAFADVVSLQVKLVRNPLEDTFSQEEGWIEISNEDDIDNLSIDMQEFYTQVEDEVAQEQREKVEAEIQATREREKAEKAAKAKLAEKKRAANSAASKA